MSTGNVMMACPSCKQVSQAPAGMVVACPFCQQHMQAPGGQAPAIGTPTQQVPGYPAGGGQPGGGWGPGGAPASGGHDAQVSAVQGALPHETPERIRTALQSSGGDVNAAVNALLTGQVGPPGHPQGHNQAPPPNMTPQPQQHPGGGAQQATVGAPAPQLTGRKKALLVGINYEGTRAALKGCVADVRRMKEFLTCNGFQEGRETMVVLTDHERNPQFQPTKQNILQAMQWLTAGAQPGDILFFHFSGHGSQQDDTSGVEEDGLNETIVPSDFKRAGQITDNEIFRLLVQPLQSGVRLTAIMDCCHSGTGMDLPWTLHGPWTYPSRLGWVEDTNPCHSLGDVQLFSGCEDDECSADSTRYGRSGGAMTTAFIETLRQNPAHTYVSLMDGLHRNLRRGGFEQRPSLTTSQSFDINRPFSIWDIHPNMNPVIGQQMRRRVRRNRRRRRNTGLNSDLGIVAGGVVTGLLGLAVLDAMF